MYADDIYREQTIWFCMILYNFLDSTIQFRSDPGMLKNIPKTYKKLKDTKLYSEANRNKTVS